MFGDLQEAQGMGAGEGHRLRRSLGFLVHEDQVVLPPHGDDAGGVPAQGFHQPLFVAAQVGGPVQGDAAVTDIFQHGGTIHHRLPMAISGGIFTK